MGEVFQCLRTAASRPFTLNKSGFVNKPIADNSMKSLYEAGLKWVKHSCTWQQCLTQSSGKYITFQADPTVHEVHSSLPGTYSVASTTSVCYNGGDGENFIKAKVFCIGIDGTPMPQHCTNLAQASQSESLSTNKQPRQESVFLSLRAVHD